MKGIKCKKTNEKFIEFAFKSKAEYAIIPIQDFLGLNNSARMNTPGTLSNKNWTWKLKDYSSFKKVIPYINSIVKNYSR